MLNSVEKNLISVLKKCGNGTCIAFAPLHILDTATGYKFGCYTVHAQFFHQNPLACLITNSHLLSNVANGPTLIQTDELWICATVSGFVHLVGLLVCSLSSTDVQPVLSRVCHWNTCVRLKLWSPKPCWIILMISVALFPRLAQNWCTLAVPFSDPSWKSPQVTYTTPNKRVWKLPMSTHLRATWHTDSLDMVVLPSAGASCYHSCFVDGGTSPEYFGSHLVHGIKNRDISCLCLFPLWLLYKNVCT